MNPFQMLNYLSQYQISAFLSGGYVRDHILGIESVDYDIECYGTTYSSLVAILEQIGTPNVVGKRYGVIKINVDGTDFDISLARRDNKNGVGRQGFDVDVDPTITPREAILRRDVTAGALLMDKNGDIYDFCGGIADIHNKCLHPVSDQFSQDPTRVMRVARFMSKYGWHESQEMFRVCASMVDQAHDIEDHMMYQEWYKLASTEYPHLGYDFLQRIGWFNVWPELNAIVGVPQNPEWHQEGSVDIHTYHVLKYAGQFKNPIVTLAALCHDLGKADYTVIDENGVIRSPGHNDPSKTISFLRSIHMPNEIVDRVSSLVQEHMIQWDTATPKMVRRLLSRLYSADDFHNLVLLIESDISGRPPMPTGRPAALQNMVDIYDNLGGSESIEPIVMGRHLIQMGYTPSPKFGKALNAAYEAQLDGETNFSLLLEIATDIMDC